MTDTEPKRWSLDDGVLVSPSGVALPGLTFLSTDSYDALVELVRRQDDAMAAVPTAVADDFARRGWGGGGEPAPDGIESARRLAAWLRVGLDAIDGGNRTTAADRRIVEPPTRKVSARDLLAMDLAENP